MYEVDLFDVSVSSSWLILIGTNGLFLRDWEVVGSTLGRGAWAAWDDHSEQDELGGPGCWQSCARQCQRCHGEEQTQTGPRGDDGSPHRGLALLLSSSSELSIVCYQRNTPIRRTMRGAMWDLYLPLCFLNPTEL